MFKEWKLQNVIDISGKDTLSDINNYTRWGETTDGNKYPLLYNGEDKWIVGVPVDEYESITEHMDTIDEQLTKLEGRTRPPIDRLLNSIVPRPFKFDHTIVVKDKDGKLSKVQSETQSRKYQWADELLRLQPSLLNNEEIDFDIKTPDSSVVVQTYLHTITYGEHRECRFIQQYHIGVQPSPLVEPSSLDIVDMADGKINEYINTVRAWKKRDKEIEVWTDYKDKVIDNGKEIIKREIAVLIGRQEMTVPKLGSHDLLSGCDIVMINPFAFWVSPSEDIPDKYKGALRGESGHMTL